MISRSPSSEMISTTLFIHADCWWYWKSQQAGREQCADNSWRVHSGDVTAHGHLNHGLLNDNFLPLSNPCLKDSAIKESKIEKLVPEWGWRRDYCKDRKHNVRSDHLLANVNSRSRSLYAIAFPSVCLSSVVCNVSAPCSVGWNFRQFFFAVWYNGHPLTFTENFTEIVPGEPLRRGFKCKRCSEI